LLTEARSLRDRDLGTLRQQHPDGNLQSSPGYPTIRQLERAARSASVGASIVGIWATTSFSLDWGWRIGLLTGGSPIVLMIFIRLFMPEAKAWLQFDRARKSGLIETKTSTTNTLLLMFRGKLLSVSLMCLAWMMAYKFAYYGVVVFMPTLMQKSLAAPPEVVRNISVICSIIGGCSYISMGALNDAFGRRFGALVPGLAWGVMAGLLFMFAREKFAGSIIGFPMFWTYVAFVIGNSALGVVGTWLSEIYPIAVRSTAVSFIYMAGRGVGSFAPVVVPLVAASLSGALAMGMLVVVPAIIIFLAMTLSLPETRGRELAVIQNGNQGRQPA
jgi:MFS family permease